jgi:hypothetical protein
MNAPEIDDTCDRIIKWLTEEGLYKDRIQDENLHFHLAVEYPAHSGRHLSIIQPKNRDDMVVVLSRIMLAEVHKNALMVMQRKERLKLLWNMRYALLFQESSFEMQPGGESLEGIQFTREIYYDGLTKNKLMEAMRENFKCELYVVWKFQEIFGDRTGSEPAESMYC